MTSPSEPRSSQTAMLEKLKLHELREIARQRGWTIKASTKAEYVQRLVPLLCDRAEVVRAVTSLQEPLLRVLQAAFILESGSGVTPEALARTLNALMPSAFGDVKAVEALALLRDLSRWGLVIPWRGFTNGPRFVFPAEVQHAVPPLPGWCEPPPSKPEPSTRADDRFDLPQLIAAIWDVIADRRLKVRTPPEPPAERRLRSFLGDWQTDSEQLRQLRSGLATSARLPSHLRISPAPFLLQDEDMHKLAADVGADVELLEFAIRLLQELTLVSSRRGRLSVHAGRMRSFAQRSRNQQRVALLQSYLSLLGWSELDVVLRTDARLVLLRGAQTSFSHAQQRSQLRSLRHTILRTLATAGDKRWCSFDYALAQLHALWPSFLPLLRSSHEDRLTHGSRPPWFVSWRDRREPLCTEQARDWSALQGEFVRFILEGPLHWLGLADLHGPDGHLEAFRLLGLSDLLRDGPRSGRRSPEAASPIHINEADSVVVVNIHLAPPEASLLLGKIARLTKASDSEYTFHLDMRAAYATFARNSLHDWLECWQRAVSSPLPESIYQKLSSWWDRYGQVHLYEGLALLEVKDELTAQEIKATTSLGRHLVAELSPRLLLIRDQSAELLLSELADRGYMPRHVEDSVR